MRYLIEQFGCVKHIATIQLKKKKKNYIVKYYYITLYYLIHNLTNAVNIILIKEKLDYFWCDRPF